MPQKFCTFSVSPANQANTMAVRQVVNGAIDNTLPAAPTAMTVVTSGNEPMLIVYDSSVDTAQGYNLDAGSTDLTATASFKIGAGWDFVEAFVDNDSAYLMCYRASDGTFAFYKLALPLANPVTFSLTHSPGMTKGYTTVKPFLSPKGAAFLGYNKANGSVAIYSFAPGQAKPSCVWWHQWAEGWTRFAFFQFGGENFFFKTNIAKLNVNIDHVLDGLVAGTVQVATNLVLENALELTAVAPLTSANGDPHFVTYMPDGTTSLNRFNGDCLGWTNLAVWNSLPNATHVVPFRVGTDTFVLFA
jgi:hypothetical protein